MIIGVIIAAVLAGGAYLKWAVRPVLGAYHVGRGMERLMMDPARFAPAFTTGYRIGRRDRARAGGG